MDRKISNLTLELILKHYAKDASRRDNEREWYAATGLPLSEAIQRAAESVYQGKMNSHQWRVGRRVLSRCEQALAPMENLLGAAKSFAEIHVLVEGKLREVDRAGALTAYDIADRIALYRGYTPSEVYLHAGTRVGALEVLGRLPRGAKSLPRSVFGSWFGDHDERDIENMLCVYAGIFTLPPDEARVALDRLDRKRRGPRC